jgi:hypothetical protein
VPFEVPVTVIWYAPLVVEDVVVAVSVAVSAVVLLIETEVGERLHVAGLEAFEILVVTAQVSATVPVNEFDGVTEMVEVPVAPAVTVMLPLLLRAKSVLPAGAAQKFLHPVRKPVPRRPMPNTLTASIPVRSGATNSSRARSPILIPAPL